jgi:hypothetical protein
LKNPVGAYSAHFTHPAGPVSAFGFADPLPTNAYTRSPAATPVGMVPTEVKPEVVVTELLSLTHEPTVVPPSGSVQL